MENKFSSIISFRVHSKTKEEFKQKCNNFSFVPPKYAMGNTLRRFISCYIQNPRYFENIFSHFDE